MEEKPEKNEFALAAESDNPWESNALEDFLAPTEEPTTETPSPQVEKSEEVPEVEEVKAEPELEEEKVEEEKSVPNELDGMLDTPDVAEEITEEEEKVVEAEEEDEETRLAWEEAEKKEAEEQRLKEIEDLKLLLAALEAEDADWGDFEAIETK